LFKANLNIKFWDFALVYATILCNNTPHSSIQNNIPNELFYWKRVNLSKIKVFGCIAYHSNLQDKASRLNENSDKGIFLGIDTFSKSYIIINCRSHYVVSTREATFFEEKFMDLPEFPRDSDYTLFVIFPSTWTPLMNINLCLVMHFLFPSHVKKKILVPWKFVKMGCGAFRQIENY